MRSLTAAFLSAVLAACGSSPAPSASTDPTCLGVTNLAMPLPGLYSSGQPTEQQFAQFAAVGIKHVVCLRPATESGTGWEEAKAKELGITFTRVPVAGPQDVTFANATRLGELVKGANGEKTLVCCHSSNRVGALLALHAFHDGGHTADEALAIGRAAGLTKLEPVVQKLLTAPPPPAPAPAPVAETPKSLKKAMKTIEDDWHHVEELLDADPAKDLPGIAAAARRMAAVMKLGYDTFEDKEVPDFATMAKDAEAAMLDLAQRAAAGDAAAIKALQPTLQKQHCARCHDAVEEVHG